MRLKLGDYVVVKARVVRNSNKEILLRIIKLGDKFGEIKFKKS